MVNKKLTAINASQKYRRYSICGFAKGRPAQLEDHPRPLPFDDIPGPKPLPIIGNFWRFLPVVGSL